MQGSQRMSREHYELMISELGKAAGLTLEPDDTGYSSLEIDGSLVANIQYVTASDSIYIFYELGRIEEHVLAKACERLLAANLFGVETGGGVLAMHSDSHELVFSYSASAAEANTVRFQQLFENILRYAEYWKDELKTMNREISSQEELANDPRMTMIRA